MIRQYPLPLPSQESHRAEDFLPAQANEAALAWILNRPPATWPSHALILWGPEGSGKTHLLSIWAEKEGAVSATPGDENIFKSGASGAFVLDDADDLAGQKDFETWLFHLFNVTRESGAFLLMTASAPPSMWTLTLPDLSTRLKSCQTVELLPPDDDLMRGLLLKLFADRQLIVESGVVEYLATRLDRTGRAVMDAVRALDEAALEMRHKISIPFVQRILFPKDS